MYDNCNADFGGSNSCTGCGSCNDILIYGDLEMCVSCWSWWIVEDNARYC